jgi:hypothetical protein
MSLVPTVDAITSSISVTTGGRVDLDGLEVLGERAAIAGLRRGGRRSCGGATRLLRSADGWVALSLPRPEDDELLPAWVGDLDVEQAVAARESAELVSTGAELGLAVSRLGERGTSRPAFVVHGTVERMPCGPDGSVVVDLSSLWAGPLAASILTTAGARVIKVESWGRPDGARFGPERFFDLLHSGQESVALDFTDRAEVDTLVRLVHHADVVIEASRPRALAQLGLDASEIVARNGTIWLSITGHGRHPDGAGRAAFGDDAAVAGGLVAGSPEQPWFCADAVADPLAGLLGAAVVLDRLASGRGGLIDVSMAGVAAWGARGPRSAEPWTGMVAAPNARTPTGRSRPLGADTASVVADLVSA